MNSLYDGYREHEYTELREKYEPGYKQRNDGLNYGVKYIDQIEEFLAPHLVFPVRIFDWGGTLERIHHSRQATNFFIFMILAINQR